MIEPGATIGILGGGQLGRMLALQALAMGYRCLCLDPTPDSPCGQVCPQIVASYDDRDAVLRLAASSEVLTFEFENVPAEVLIGLPNLTQGTELLLSCQDRTTEKAALERCGLPVAANFLYRGQDPGLGYPLLAKTVRGGYDGKGQRVIAKATDLESLELDGRWLLEKHLELEGEMSVIVCGFPRGKYVTYPAHGNLHREGILRRSRWPSGFPRDLCEQARDMALTLAAENRLRGLLALEMFVTSDGRLLANEFAPRPHNSGHLTMDAAVTGQFEQHLRALCGLPPGSVEMISAGNMLNILGKDLEPVLQRLDQLPAAGKLHLYGKSDPRPGRKMGHLNVLAKELEPGWEALLCC